jgi:hypothetical protein
MNEQDLRDCFAMFAMNGIVSSHSVMPEELVAKNAYKIADAMLKAREPKEEIGITAVKRVRKIK